MRRFAVLAGAVALCLVLLTGCDMFIGEDGTAYIQMTFEYGYGGLTRLDGFPSPPYSVDTEYQITPGYHGGEYVLYYGDGPDYYEPYYYYYMYTNDTNFTYVTTYDYSPIDGVLEYQVGYYVEQGLFDAYANQISYTVTVNEGELFQDGDDTHFTLNLTWDPYGFYVSSRDVGAESARIIESSADKVVKEITDGAYTLRVEVRPNAALREGRRTPVFTN